MEEETKYPRVFKKAIKGSVGGRYINSRGDYDEFLLKGDPAVADIENVTVEITDIESEKYFLRQNKKAIVHGYLVEINDGYEMSLDATNAVGDGYLKDLLKLPFGKMKKEVEKFTSTVPVSRLLEFAIQDNKPIKTINLLEGIVSSFGTNTIPVEGSIGNVKIGSAGN